MKKLIAMMAAVCALGAFAETWSGAEEVDFSKAEEVGAWTVPEEGWTQTGTPEDFSLEIAGEENDRYLSIDTPADGSLAKTIATGDVQAGWNVNVETKVKFTAFDTEPTIDPDAKIAIYYLAQDAEGEEGQDGYVPGQTNLMVTAASLDADGKKTTTDIALAIDDFDPAGFHTLKVESLGNVAKPDKEACLGFVIYVDDVQVEAAESLVAAADPYLTAEAWALGAKLFPCLKDGGELAAVAFRGNGALQKIAIDATEGAIAITAPESEYWEASNLSKTSGNPGDSVTMTLTITDGTYLFKDGTSVKTDVAATVDANGVAQIDDKDAIAVLPVLVNVVAGGFDQDYVDLEIALAKVAELSATDPETEVDIEFLADAETKDGKCAFAKGTCIAITTDENGNSNWAIEGAEVVFLAGLENRKIVDATAVTSFTFGGLMKPGAQLTAGEITTDEDYPIVLAINGEEGGATITTTTDELAVVAEDPEAYEVEKIDNGDDTFTYQLKAITPVAYVAKIGNQGYLTLAEAVAAADGTEDVVLLADCTGVGIMVNKSITIDFGGFTYTGDDDPLAGSPGTMSQVFHLVAGNTITLKNGTITSTKARMLVQNYADLTLTDIVLDGENLSAKSGKGKDYVAYTLSNCDGNTVIAGNTTIKARVLAGQKSFAFDTYYQAGKYEDAMVTVNGATIDGDVELAGGSLTLTAGTLNGALVAGANIEKGTVTKGEAFEADAPAGYIWKDGVLTKIAEPTATVAPIEEGDYAVAVQFDAGNIGAGYDNWIAKFYLTSDVTIGADEVELGGNYGTYGWVDKDFTCEKDVPQSVLAVVGLEDDITVKTVFEDIQSFKCGVKNVALKNDATFTLKLVITDPEGVKEDIELCNIDNLKVEKKAEEDPWEKVKTENVEGFDQLEPAQQEAAQTALNEIAKAVEASMTGTSAPEDAAGWIEKVYGVGAKVPAETLAAAKNIDISVKYDLPLMTAEQPTVEIKQAVDEDKKPVEGFTFQIKDGDDAVSLEAAAEKIQSMVQFTTALDDETKPFAVSTEENVVVGVKGDNKTATATFTKKTAAGFMKVELK